MWRWSCFNAGFGVFVIVFSTYVEVILTLRTNWLLAGCFLHVCGGDPGEDINNAKSGKFSPRMWRWSWVKYYVPDRETVFSTYVEVILNLQP